MKLTTGFLTVLSTAILSLSTMQSICRKSKKAPHYWALFYAVKSIDLIINHGFLPVLLHGSALAFHYHGD